MGPGRRIAMHVLALTKYGTLAAGTRQRFLLYAPALEEAGIELTVSPFLDNDYLSRVLSGRRASLASIAGAFPRRLGAVLAARSFDLIWLHCEFFPYLPSMAETVAEHVARVPIVFDFDDAIFHMYDANAPWPVRALLEGKLDGLLKHVAAATVGNEYLREYAARFCDRTMVVPTVVDTDIYIPANRRAGGPLVIGWIGSPSTWEDVRPLLPVLEELCGHRAVLFRVVGAGSGAERDRFEGMELVSWSEASEVAEVQAFDIGIMPVSDRPWSRGKSGYKLIQYMACGVPAVGSPIGVNRSMLSPDCGILARSNEEWAAALTRLLDDPNLRRRMAAAGRKRAVEHYSLAVQAPRITELFLGLAR